MFKYIQFHIWEMKEHMHVCFSIESVVSTHSVANKFQMRFFEWMMCCDTNFQFWNRTELNKYPKLHLNCIILWMFSQLYTIHNLQWKSECWIFFQWKYNVWLKCFVVVVVVWKLLECIYWSTFQWKCIFHLTFNGEPILPCMMHDARCTMHVKTHYKCLQIFKHQHLQRIQTYFWCLYLYFDGFFVHTFQKWKIWMRAIFVFEIIIHPKCMYIWRPKQKFNDLITFWKISYCFCKQFRNSLIHYEH